MKALLMFFAVIALSPALSAGRIVPPEMLIELWAKVMNSDGESKRLSGIDYKRISSHDPKWTSTEVRKLFGSIPPEKLKFHKRFPSNPVVIMTAPIRMRFTFETRPTPKAPPGLSMPPFSFWLIKIVPLSDKEAQ